MRNILDRSLQDRENLPTMDFRQAISEIFWSWQLCSSSAHHQLSRDEHGIHVDKLFIGPEGANYKTSVWVLEPGVYSKLNQFLDLLLPMLEPVENEIKSD